MDTTLPPDHITSRKDAKEGGYMYFHGSPCKRGGHTLRYANGHCVECQREKASSDDMMRYKKEYRSSNKHKIKEYNQYHYWKDREASIQRVKEYQKNNKEKVKLAAKKAREKSSEKRKELKKQWVQKNIEHVRAYEQKQRAKRAYKADGYFTASDIMFLMRAQKEKCVYCGTGIKNNYHIDHIMPLAKGGTNDKKNIQLLCPKCNMSKHAKHPIDFALENGKLC